MARTVARAQCAWPHGGMRGCDEWSRRAALRSNIAINAVSTSHFLVTDVDLWPSKTLYQIFLNLPTHYLAADNYAMVVPAFEISSNVHKSIGTEAVPDTFAGLQVCSDFSICQIFKHKTDTHTSTWYKRWWEQTEAEGAYKVPCFDSIRYEPYLLVPKAEQTPLFDERFVGYGKNKIQFVQHLRLLGFQFFVLPQAPPRRRRAASVLPPRTGR